MADDITYQHITGEWAHVVDDGITDPDAEPDEVRPTGKVLFTPLLGSNGFLPSGEPTKSVTVAPVTALIADGVLTDIQGRDGIWLVATIGGYPIHWTATPTLTWQNTKLASKPITFAPPPDGETEVHLNDLVDVTPPSGNDNGRPTPLGTLNLPAVGDYTYTFRSTHGDLGDGAQLYYLIGSAPSPSRRWDFVIVDGVATIVVPVADHSPVPPGSQFWLIHKAGPSAPATELLTGPVRKGATPA
ncbi:LtfC-like domain-containing protein [Gordonia soli]|uniref:LtfC/p132/Gp6 beta-sandwich domain-containing protein n=1 Tax=Gordonia soli NBRC 108243 TaxID=1223545 RepID=M0QS93_9ACTN|nr:hypothetical protein [Gordonia soli]GAC71047.1 hypothetical protein GS4_47_00370 [Gordonia soli NBRC 108243]